jgi:DNA polymerase-3 subunit delta
MSSAETTSPLFGPMPVGPAAAASRVPGVSAWKPAYLVHGDDHGRIGERRANLRRKAEQEAGAEGVEGFEGERSTPATVAGGLNALTFSVGHRFLVVDGVERWKDAEVTEHLAPALKAMDPDTTIAFFGRDEGRATTPKALIEAVKKTGGVVGEETVLKAKDLPRWVAAEAAKLGLKLDPNAARLLVDAVGERQQRLLRELEKLALEHGPGAQLDEHDVAAVAAPSAERQVWALVDALVAGQQGRSLRAFLELRDQGESLPRLVPLVARRLREVLSVAVRLEAGESPSQIKSTLKMAPWAADRRLKEARATDAEALRAGLESLAGLELASRGLGEVSEDTAALRTLLAITA